MCIIARLVKSFIFESTFKQRKSFLVQKEYLCCCFGSFKRWWLISESNQGHADFQSTALPTELSGQNQNELVKYHGIAMRFFSNAFCNADWDWNRHLCMSSAQTKRDENIEMSQDIFGVKKSSRGLKNLQEKLSAFLWNGFLWLVFRFECFFIQLPEIFTKNLQNEILKGFFCSSKMELRRY